MKYLIGAGVLMLACACSPASAPSEAPETPVTDVRAGAELELQPLVGEDTRGRLSGELGCSFSVGDETMLLAMGFVDPAATAEALVKRSGVVVQMPATATGGYDGLVDGETFTADGLSVEVRPGAAIETGTEEVRQSATLTARDASGERSYEGAWTCGP